MWPVLTQCHCVVIIVWVPSMTGQMMSLLLPPWLLHNSWRKEVCGNARFPHGCLDVSCHGIKARTHACVEITHFPTRRIIRTWNALGLRPCASHARQMHLAGKCVISTWSGILAIIFHSIVVLKFSKVISNPTQKTIVRYAPQNDEWLLNSSLWLHYCLFNLRKPHPSLTLNGERCFSAWTDSSHI